MVVLAFKPVTSYLSAQLSGLLSNDNGMLLSWRANCICIQNGLSCNFEMLPFKSQGELVLNVDGVCLVWFLIQNHR